jgi:hypothetical protein
MPSSPQATASPSMMQDRGRQPREALNDEREAIGQVITGPAVELHPLAVLAGDHPKAVVLDFVQPLLTGRRL